MRVLRQLLISACLSLVAANSLAGTVAWTDIPRAQWKGNTRADVEAFKRPAAAVVALPAGFASALTVASAVKQPAGLYEVRIIVRPSHTADSIAFNSCVQVMAETKLLATFQGNFFARTHEPETRSFHVVHSTSGPLTLRLNAVTDAEIAQRQWIAASLKNGGPEIGDIDTGEDDEIDDELALDIVLAPDRAVYFLVDKVEFRPLSQSGRVQNLEINKIRYLGGEALHGSAVVEDVGRRGGSGALRLHLEHDIDERTLVKTIPVTLTPAPKTVAFEIALPREELGYALVAEFVSDDGKDRSEAAEYFSIAANFQRVAVFGGGLSTRDAILDDETIRSGLRAAREDYYNASEYFSWAEDDMVEMSPDADFWSSGQTNYRMHKRTIQRQIQLAHEQGLAAVTYGKFVMSGLKGWETAYDYPNDHRDQYRYPVGMWNDVNVSHLDRRRSGDFCVYGKTPQVTGRPFRVWWDSFLPINPDATPRMARIAAEECVRSVDMFAWDAIRWDGHPRGGGQCGAAGTYDLAAARRTQALVRYFKEIVARTHPEFRHGYNYLLIQKEKDYAWAVEDYELDELCRGGGLLMNESIGNASEGWSFGLIARNLQVDGDLCRERGGYYLGISYAKSPRDAIIESALWAAAGCRPYNSAMTREIRRYCIRYSQYTFDEHLRRLAEPDKLLAAQSKTHLQWKSFVYETPQAHGTRRLVINLLNIPLQATRPPREEEVPPQWDMPRGTDPVVFALSLPEGYSATGARLIEPQTLAVEELELDQGRFEVPAVAVWKVAVIDLAVDPGAPPLASLCGAPTTFGVTRAGVKEVDRRPDVVLDPTKDIWEVNKRMDRLTPTPAWVSERVEARAKIEAMPSDARDAALMARRPRSESLMKEWWKGGSLPHDLELKGKRFDFSGVAPQRNERFDIFYGRGPVDYRLRMPAAFARLERFRIHDAPLAGVLRHGPNMGLSRNVSWRSYSDFDLLLFTGIPHCAIGAENCYALPHYVRAGGGAFFTGGEYAFGKGGYIHTILERELLPLWCTEMEDTVYSEKPSSFEAGPDFATLGVDLDFAARPSFWVRNQVVLKKDAKVFLRSGDHPILVGRQLGKGRVACLLIDHRGKSEDGVTAFFDWQDWPMLVEAVLRWLAPDAPKTVRPASAEASTAQILAQLQDAGIEADLDDLDMDDGDDPILGDDGAGASVSELNADALIQRVALIDRALALGGPQISAALAEQLAGITNLPLKTRLRILGLLQQHRPDSAGRLGRAAISANDSVVRGNAYVLLGLSGSPEFATHLARPEPIMGEPQFAMRERLRDLVMGIALYPNADLVGTGRRRVESLNERERGVKRAFAERCGPDTDLLQTAPFLDAEEILQRVAWLAYLSRRNAESCGAQFAREWAMIGEYQDYCDRGVAYVYEELKRKGTAESARAQAQEWLNLSLRLGALQDLTRPDMEALLANSPEIAAAGLSKARFAPEVRACINLLGSVTPAAASKVLRQLAVARNSDLAGFAAARLRK